MTTRVPNARDGVFASESGSGAGRSRASCHGLRSELAAPRHSLARTTLYNLEGLVTEMSMKATLPVVLRLCGAPRGMSSMSP